MADAQQRPVVIAHRGASAYLPEHTLAAKALAFGLGADFLEQDVVLTKDDRPIVLHDIHLDTVTDVARVFPGRQRADGRFYALDFTLDEIKQLRVHERIDLEDGQAVYPNRFPVGRGSFTVATLAEEMELVQGLNKTMRRQVGIYPEIKAPTWHRREGRDISSLTLATLARYGYQRRDDPIYLQCFDAAELKRIRSELGCDLKLVQLIGDSDLPTGTDRAGRRRGLEAVRDIASYADGIGPRIEHLIAGRDAAGKLQVSPLAAWAHQHNLVVHPYTLRLDALPKTVKSAQELLAFLAEEAAVDGFFTDFPDVFAAGKALQ